MKRCTKCGDTKPYTAFDRDKRRGYRSHCKDCRRLYNRTAKGREAKRRQNFRRRYGIAVPAGLYESLYERQGGRCAVCGVPECRSGAEFALDHCHRTGVFRGLLCSRCNLTISQFDDDPVQLELFGRNAARYLTRCKA